MTAFAAAATLPASLPAQRRAPVLTPVRAPVQLQSLEFTGSGMVWLNDTTLALVDGDAKQVVTAGVRSGALRRYGREGSGPGEFRTPTFILPRADAVLVDDIAGRRVSHFDAGMKFVASTRTPGATLALLEWSGKRLRLAWIDFAAGGGGPAVSDIDLGTGTAAPVFTVFTADSALAVRSAAMGAPSPFLAITSGPARQVLAGSPSSYRITVFDSTGRRLRSFGRDLPPTYRTDAEVEEIVARTRRMVARAPGPEGARSSMIDRLREGLKKEPKPHFGMGGIVVDAMGRAWVSTGRVTTSTELDVFDGDGAYLGAVRVAGRVASLAVRLPWLAVLSERTTGDEEGIQGIDLYRIAPSR